MDSHSPESAEPVPVRVIDYLDLAHTDHRALFEENAHCWAALDQIASYLKFRLKPAVNARLVGRPFVSNQVFLGEGTVVENGATLIGPAWIGANCHVRSGAYIREQVIVGDGVVLGNSCEFKNCVIFNGAQIPHFNYVGDSILGHKAHLGAGVILSNVRLDNGEVTVRAGARRIPTGRRKFGAVVGDGAEVGCNAVLSPGSLLGPRSVVYPGAHWRGVLPAGRVAKVTQAIEVVDNTAASAATTR